MKFDFDMDLDFGLWHLCDWVPGWDLEWALPDRPEYVFDPCVVVKLRTYNMLWNLILDLDFGFGLVLDSEFWIWMWKIIHDIYETVLHFKYMCDR